MDVQLGTFDRHGASMVIINLSKKAQYFASSPFASQQQIARRLLANKQLPGIFVAPLKDLAKLAIIGENSMIDPPCPEMERFLLQHDLSLDGTQEPDYFTLEAALKFTLYAWMEAENWLKVGDSLMPNAILEEMHEAPNIAFNCVFDSSSEVHVTLSASNVRIHRFEQGMLDVNIVERWVFVLPKLGRGRVVGVHRALPAHAPFRDYAELRKYWKDSYGYHLPLDELGCYYDIKFNGMKTTMLYPFFLVLASRPEVLLVNWDRKRAEEKMLADFYPAFARACDGRQLAGMTIETQWRPTNTQKIPASLAVLQPTRKRLLPRLGLHRPNGPTNYTASGYMKPIREDGSEEEEPKRKLPKLSSERNNNTASSSDAFLSTGLGSSKSTAWDIVEKIPAKLEPGMEPTLNNNNNPSPADDKWKFAGGFDLSDDLSELPAAVDGQDPPKWTQPKARQLEPEPFLQEPLDLTSSSKEELLEKIQPAFGFRKVPLAQKRIAEPQKLAEKKEEHRSELECATPGKRDVRKMAEKIPNQTDADLVPKKLVASSPARKCLMQPVTAAVAEQQAATSSGSQSTQTQGSSQARRVVLNDGLTLLDGTPRRSQRQRQSGLVFK